MTITNSINKTISYYFTNVQLNFIQKSLKYIIFIYYSSSTHKNAITLQSIITS